MIPLMDVQRQYMNHKNEIDEAVIQVLESGQYINGEDVHIFEREFADYVGSKYAIAVANGTDALVIALRAAGIGIGHEVITTAMTFFATAEAIISVGATPVLVDCDKDSYTIDVTQIEQLITDKTKAIIPVHLYGQCADMDSIMHLAKKYNLIIIEDTAQAIGSEYKGRKAGSIGDVGCFSFFPTKNLGCCGDGGIIVTNNEKIAQYALSLRAHGSGKYGKKYYEEINDIEMNQDAEQTHPDKYYNYVCGYNSRLDTIQAAILRVKLKYLDQSNNKRIQLAHRYNKLLTNALLKPAVMPNTKHCFYVYVIIVPNREKIMTHLKNINISSGVYYPIPLHLQKALSYLGYSEGDFPQSERIANQSLAIPMFPELHLDEQNLVIDTVNSMLNK